MSWILLPQLAFLALVVLGWWLECREHKKRGD